MDGANIGIATGLPLLKLVRKVRGKPTEVECAAVEALVRKLDERRLFSASYTERGSGGLRLPSARSEEGDGRRPREYRGRRVARLGGGRSFTRGPETRSAPEWNPGRPDRPARLRRRAHHLFKFFSIGRNSSKLAQTKSTCGLPSSESSWSHTTISGVFGFLR